MQDANSYYSYALMRKSAGSAATTWLTWCYQQQSWGTQKVGVLPQVQAMGAELPQQMPPILGRDLKANPPGQGQRGAVTEALLQGILTTSASQEPESVSANTPTFRSRPNRNSFVSTLLYPCSIFTVMPPEVLDTRPHLSGTLEGSF